MGAADAVKLNIASKKIAALFKSFDRYFIELVAAADAVKLKIASSHLDEQVRHLDC